MTIPEIVLPLVVKLVREPGMDTVCLMLPDGSSEELEAPDAEEWFRVRNANMAVVDKALTYVWNFYTAEVVIEKPRLPQREFSRVTPRV